MTLISSLLTISTGQILSTGSCPKINATENFSLPRFIGKWFEIRAFPYFYTLGGSCVSWTFSPNDNDGSLIIETRQTRYGIEEVTVGECEILRSGVILISYPNSTVLRTDTNFYVLDTDYDHYAVLFTCTHALFINAQNAWVLSRKSTLEDMHLQKAMDSLEAQTISSSLLVAILQTCGST